VNEFCCSNVGWGDTLLPICPRFMHVKIATGFSTGKMPLRDIYKLFIIKRSIRAIYAMLNLALHMPKLDTSAGFIA